ncbi:MAG: SDR family NAD(P)-dependent oxidoreductase, partial [Verrucomicrobia bacterium]|nr:SDR family NAD(P)-dependent oxidoreductase [Verrucomicrobiota bacterium]
MAGAGAAGGAVSTGAGARSAVDQAVAAFGRLDGLINNAAYFREVRLTAFEDLDPEQWERIFQVNVKGVWL